MRNLIITIITFLIVGFVYGQDNYNIKNLDVNTKYSDFGVSFYGNDAVYTSAKNKKNKSRINWINGQPHLELYKGKINNSGEIINSDLFSENISTKFHESNAVFTSDLKTVYFTRNNYFKKRYKKDSLGRNLLKMFKAEINDTGKWTNITPMPFNNDNYSVGHPALSPDEKELYFISDMPGGMGETDVYKCSIELDGSYGEPINMGSKINTTGKEMFPFISKKGDLYFSSDRKGGFGGLDIYVVSLNNKNSIPKKLNSPLNSPLDDFSFIIDSDTNSGYFSSNRIGGHGDDDIYSFDMLSEPKTDCTQIIAGTVRDKTNGSLLPGALVELYKGSKKIESVIVGSDAKFSFKNMDCSSIYNIKCNKENFIGEEKTITTTQESNLKLGLELGLNPKENIVEKELDRCQSELNNINTIYFDLNKYYIRNDAAIELDKIVNVMNKCKDIKVIAGSHTDSRGSDEYNMTLSQNRAQSTVDYIVSKGISASRIMAMGFGETQLLNECSNGVKCSKEKHQINRRTKFLLVR